MNETKKYAFLFPGQGAQYPGMSKDFVEHFPVARRTFEEADDVLGRRLSTIILEGPENVLTETANSQTGIYVASMAILRVINEFFPELTPTVCSGLSLGEYTALACSQRLSFEEGLRLVDLRGKFMNDACETHPGTMAVVLGLSGQEVETIVKSLNLPRDLWTANFNCPGQIVISGTTRGIEEGTAALKLKGAKRVLPLQVHGAFHSGLMKEAEERLKEYIVAAPLKDGTSLFVMNVPGDYVKDTAQVRDFLIQQVTSPVRWEEGVRKMDASGIDCYLEIGCGKALSGFNKRIGVAGQTISIEKITDLETLDRLLRAV